MRRAQAGPAMHYPVPSRPININAQAHSPPPLVEPIQQGDSRTSEYQRFSSPPVPASSVKYASPPGPAAYQTQAGPSSYEHQQARPQAASAFDGWAGQGNRPAWANDATTQMGMQFGRSAVAAGSEYVERNVCTPRSVPMQLLTCCVAVHKASSYHAFTAFFQRVESVCAQKASASSLPLASRVYTREALSFDNLTSFMQKPWSRLVKRSESSGQAEGYRPPREDINSPDLYIPSE